jgi:hypothetical protein
MMADGLYRLFESRGANRATLDCAADIVAAKLLTRRCGFERLEKTPLC